MTKSYAILIDGGFVKRKLGTARVPMDSVVLNRFVQALQELPELRPHSLHRIYYYDAEPSADVVKKPLSEEILDFGRGISKIIDMMKLEEGGYQLISNSGKFGMQEVMHMHVHILGKSSPEN